MEPTPSTRRRKTVTWSKNGFIAYVAPTNGPHNVFLTYLENVDGRLWQLAEPIGITVKPDGPAVPEVVHVEWSNLSTDLAVWDSKGNFYILLAGVGLLGRAERAPSPGSTPSYEITSYNHTEMIYREIRDDSVPMVTFKWLNIEKPQIINKPATLVHNEQQPQGPLAYVYGVNQFNSYGATHPISTKQACVALREDGQLTLYYQGEHKVEYRQVLAKVAPDVKLTKASIGFDGRKIVGAAYDTVLDRIIVFGADIEWGFLVESSKKQKVDPHYHTPKEAQIPPKLLVELITDTKPLLRLSIDTIDKPDDAMDVDDDAKYQMAVTQLSSIDIVSPNYQADTELFILVTYERETEGVITLAVYRFSIVDVGESVSSAFMELGMRKNVARPENVPTSKVLELQDKLVRAGSLVSIDTAIAETFVVATFEDGRVDVIDRSSLQVLQVSTNTTPSTISNLFDVGFVFPKIERTSKNLLMIGISPNLLSIVYTEVNDASNRLKLRVMERASPERSPKDLFITSVGFAFRHAYACYTNTCADDLVALIQMEILNIGSAVAASGKPANVAGLTSRLVESIICESHKAINFQLDAFGKESVDKLLLNPPLQKLLSLQLVLGELQVDKPTVVDLAWVVLNLRSTSFGIMFSLSSIYRQISKKKPAEDSLLDLITRAECIMSLVGNVKWLIDLMIYLNQELLQLAYAEKSPENSKLSYSNSIVLPLLLSKVPRLFLMYAWSSISKTQEILKKLHKDLTDSNKLFTPMKEALNRYFTVCRATPLSLTFTDTFLRECDGFISKELGLWLSNKDRSQALKIEQKLVCQGEVPQDLLPIAKSIVKRHAASIQRDVKVAELFFYDVSWVDIGVMLHRESWAHDSVILDGPSQPTISRQRYGAHDTVDALRKIIIETSSKRRQAKLRKCTRCRSVSLVSDPLIYETQTAVGLWTMVFQRTCICGSAWVNEK